jgi:hypothetical protein
MSNQLGDILYTDFQDMLVLSLLLHRATTTVHMAAVPEIVDTLWRCYGQFQNLAVTKL